MAGRFRRFVRTSWLESRVARGATLGVRWQHHAASRLWRSKQSWVILDCPCLEPSAESDVMSLPTAYLTSARNLPDILTAIQAAQAPKKFTQAFLEGLGFKSTADRLIIGVLKALGFLNASGEPTQRYFEFLDQSQSARVLAEGIQDAYADLFQINKKAHELSNVDIRNKLKTLTQGQFSDAVLDKMAMTFKALAAQADFATAPKVTPVEKAEPSDREAASVSKREELVTQREGAHAVRLGGLVYNIQIHLPESRDAAVYDVLFRSLKDHLLR
jgi:hypothetical protein